MKGLSRLETLRTLNLANTRISDDAVAELAKLKSLTSLNLRQTRITQAGKDRLAKELPECKIEWSLARERSAKQ
jgi:hypothetical protein